MAYPSDSQTNGIAVTFTFTEQGAKCLPPSVLEALRNVDARINLPDSASESVEVSTLSDNLIRLDASGALYAPAPQVVELGETTITISDTTAPGVPTTMNFSATAVRDLETSFPLLFFDYSPPGGLVRHQAPRLVGSNIAVDFYRFDNASGPPYDEVVVRGRGRVLVIPAPSTS